MEFLIFTVGLSALYFVGNAIAATLDYNEVNKRRYK